jgi:hypothetical protein
MGQPGLVHDRVDTDPVYAVGAEQRTGRVQDTLAGFGFPPVRLSPVRLLPVRLLPGWRLPGWLLPAWLLPAWLLRVGLWLA